MLNKRGLYEYNHPRALMAVDAVIVSLIDNDLKVLLINQNSNLYTLPGRIVHVHEDNGMQWFDNDTTNYTNLERVKSELLKTIKLKVEVDGLTLNEYRLMDDVDIIPLEIRDAPTRDRDRSIIKPNEKDRHDWVVSMPFLMLVNGNYFKADDSNSDLKANIFRQDIELKGLSDNEQYKSLRWASLYKILKDNTSSDGRTLYDISLGKCLPGESETRDTIWTDNGDPRKYQMIFDHSYVVLNALQVLRQQARLRAVGKNFFRTADGNYRFSFQQLHAMYQLIANKPLEISNLKKTLVKERKLVKESKDEDGKPIKIAGSTRPSQLYEFDDDYYDYYNANYNLSLRL